MKTRLLTLSSFVLALVFSGCVSGPRPASDHAAMNAESTRRGAMADSAKSVVADAETPDPTRMLIWRAWLTVEVASVSNAVSHITDIATQSGGYVEGASDTGDERASITLRVPVDALKPAIASLESIGEVLHRRISSQDITEQYVDIEARLQTMEALRDRLRTLLDRAEDVKDVLAIEKELGRVQADIDAMQARLKSLKGQVEFAAVNVTIRRKRILGPLGYVFRGTWWTLKKLFVIQK